LLGRENQDVVLADRVSGLDGHAEAARPVRGEIHRDRKSSRRRHARLKHDSTGVLVEILDESGRRVSIEVLDERFVTDVDLLSLEERGHGNHDRKLLQVALEVVDHRHHRPIAVTNEDDLRGLVEEFRVGLGDVEAAEAKDRRRRPYDERRHRHAEHLPFHTRLL
jgi:hypothetical protein